MFLHLGDFHIQLCHLEYIHSCNFIHRDLKLSNIIMGVGKNVNLVYIIDFGLSKQFRDPDTHTHILYSQGRSFTGIAHFIFINSHIGLELAEETIWSRLPTPLFISFMSLYCGRSRAKNPSHETENHFTQNVFQLPIEVADFPQTQLTTFL